ncbi:hypothetical protein [Escherichia ruysiae]|uniref:hypothetical protein n=1 Tax=Escherichia ruysiae TaxID=2608867 RepID=UPI001581B0FC|nr:hypothetical protein [Escherichia ruysiae]MBY7191536.1 hypothetical protein [Escherichia ruysiae]MBY7277196.1 hypothetical protein [Escherichia ruysiae]
MLRFITVLVSALLLMQSAFADTVRPEIGKYVFGYRGQEGAVVWMMRIGPKASNEALIQVSHVDNDIDGQIFRCKVKALQDGEKSYTAVINGEDFELLRLKEGKGSLHIPDESATWSVAYSSELSDSDVANPEHFLTAYQNQQAPQ